ncbi:hypothetical protein HEB94_000664 [Actinopolymorpha pittospori]|uniref:Uncharacterized protein n=1 Tax=Actinopolymorpha pittospori TaxID=648752 RepID=A0A927MN91_9ACTN|nr:hypothetical protein [Actinopolymorpha pittospori]
MLAVGPQQPQGELDHPVEVAASATSVVGA